MLPVLQTRIGKSNPSPGASAYSDVAVGSRYILNNGTRVGYFYVPKLPGTVSLDPGFAQGLVSAGGAGATPTTETLGGKAATVVNGATNAMGVWSGGDAIVVVVVSQSAAGDAPAIIGALASANPLIRGSPTHTSTSAPTTAR